MAPQTIPAQPTLLSLPQELRDQILSYILLKPTNTITMLGNFGCHKGEISACPPAICAVNRQLRNETLPIFYSGNSFTAQLDNTHDLETALLWLNALGDEKVRHLKSLALCGWTRIPFGHMMTRIWIRVVLDLKAGHLDFRGEDDQFGDENEAPHRSRVELDELPDIVQDLNESYRQMFVALGDRSFDVLALSEFLKGFNLLCTGY